MRLDLSAPDWREEVFACMAHDLTEEFMPIRNWDHIEFYVGNARQAAHYYATTFGFTVTAYAGLETGVRDRASYVLEQGKIRLVFTSALLPDSLRRIGPVRRVNGGNR